MPKDGPLAHRNYDPMAAELAKERLSNAIKNNKEYILIVRGNTAVSYVAVGDVYYMLDAAKTIKDYHRGR